MEPTDPPGTEPLTPLAQDAARHHEMYLAYIEAGFTEVQALDLLKTIIATLIGRP